MGCGENELERFLPANERDFETALSEIRSGRKRSHWMWYIFPQVQGLGFSSTAMYYGIRNLEEARAFLSHPVLGRNLLEITGVLLELEGSDPAELMGWPDELKLCSCMTLFELADPEQKLFGQVLDKYYSGQRDSKTIYILERGY